MSFAITVTALSLAGMLVVGQLYTVIPLFALMAADWGSGSTSVAWTATAFAIAYATGFLFAGPAADRFGPRRMIVVGLAATAVVTAAVPLASSLGAALVLRAVQGLVAATFAPSAFAYIATRVDPHRRVTAITWLTSSFLAAAVLGQLAAQGIGQALGWEPVFLVGGAALALGAVGLRLVLRADEAAGGATVADAFTAMAGLVGNGRLLLLYGATLTVLTGFVGVYSGLQVAGPSALAGDEGALLALRASALPAMLAIPLLTPWLARIAPERRIALSLGAAALLAVVCAFLGGGVAIGVCLFVFVAGIAVAAPGLVQAIGARAGAARGSAVALYTFFLFVGAGLGPQLATALTGFGFPAVSLAAAAILGAGALLALGSTVRSGGARQL
ncbi:MFS transporter [Nocardiopsis deserti]|uniref:MFS transporter n=1 Tax=Nocardiopsis deserti TaxID=2605988 RepID=UPI001CC254DB|nr:MFS transporter [Nocardiopsis deserti]